MDQQVARPDQRRDNCRNDNQDHGAPDEPRIVGVG
jgi:hypothetical protein